MTPLLSLTDLPARLVEDLDDGEGTNLLVALGDHVETLRMQLLLQRIERVLLSHPPGNWDISFQVDGFADDGFCSVMVSYEPTDDDIVFPAGVSPCRGLEDWLQGQVNPLTPARLDGLSGQTLVVEEGRCKKLEQVATALWGDEYLAACQQRKMQRALEGAPLAAPKSLRL